MSTQRYPFIVTIGIGLLFWAVIGLTAFVATSQKTVYNKPVEVDAKTFGAAVAEYDVTVIVFRADWCPACKRLDPILDVLAATHAGKMRIVTVNVDKTDTIPLGYEAPYIPWVVVRNKGADVFSGTLEDKDHLNRIVAKELGIK